MLQLLESKHRACESVTHVRLELGLDRADLAERRFRLVAKVLDQIGDTADYGGLVELAAGLLELSADLVAKSVEFGGHWLSVGLFVHACLELLHLFAEIVDVHPGEARRLLDAANLMNGPKAQVLEGR